MADKFNVVIRDRHYHEIHHALGCPWPEEVMGETYRNYFACDAQSATGKAMRESDHWTNGSTKFGSTSFSVTDKGKMALLEYMRANVEVPARYKVTYKNHDGETLVPAKSRSAAKYAAYLHNDIEWPFNEFLTEVKSVRIHTRSHLITQPEKA